MLSHYKTIRDAYVNMFLFSSVCIFFQRPKLLSEPTLTSALAAAVNLSDSEAAVSALSEFLLQKYQNVKQAGAVFLEEEDFYADVKMVRYFCRYYTKRSAFIHQIITVYNSRAYFPRVLLGKTNSASKGFGENFAFLNRIMLGL